MSDMLEYVNQLVIVPRLCEMCLEHPASFYWYATWPSTYFCRLCWDRRSHEFLAAARKYGGRAGSDSPRALFPVP